MTAIDKYTSRIAPHKKWKWTACHFTSNLNKQCFMSCHFEWTWSAGEKSTVHMYSRTRCSLNNTADYGVVFWNKLRRITIECTNSLATSFADYEGERELFWWGRSLFISPHNIKVPNYEIMLSSDKILFSRSERNLLFIELFFFDQMSNISAGGRCFCRTPM